MFVKDNFVYDTKIPFSSNLSVEYNEIQHPLIVIYTKTP